MKSNLSNVRNINGLFGLTSSEIKLLRGLSTPKKIQDFLDTLPINMEENGDTYMSVRRVLKYKKAMCIEGALLASLAIWMHGGRPLILDLKSSNGDDHVVSLFKQGGRWGAISKTNHATLRFRDPVYKTIRELALSYFHEYIHLRTGEKILVSFSEPFDLRKVKAPRRNMRESVSEWITGEAELFWLADALDSSPHHKIYPDKNRKQLRKGDKMELLAGNILEWEMPEIRKARKSKRETKG